MKNKDPDFAVRLEKAIQENMDQILLSILIANE